MRLPQINPGATHRDRQTERQTDKLSAEQNPRRRNPLQILSKDQSTFLRKGMFSNPDILLQSWDPHSCTLSFCDVLKDSDPLLFIPTH
jgi:hypothetical protein